MCMFRFDMHILNSHTHTQTPAHTLQERKPHDWHQEKQKQKQRINVSVVAQNITDEVKLQVQ